MASSKEATVLIGEQIQPLKKLTQRNLKKVSEDLKRAGINVQPVNQKLHPVEDTIEDYLTVQARWDTSDSVHWKQWEDDRLFRVLNQLLSEDICGPLDADLNGQISARECA